MAIAGHIARILLAYSLACLVASLLSFASIAIYAIENGSWQAAAKWILVFILPTLARTIALSLVPVAAVILFFKIYRVRTLWTNLLAGMLISLSLILIIGGLFVYANSDIPEMGGWRDIFLLFSPVSAMIEGICAGAIYWVIAGRYAGALRRPPKSEQRAAAHTPSPA